MKRDRRDVAHEGGPQHRMLNPFRVLEEEPLGLFLVDNFYSAPPVFHSLVPAHLGVFLVVDELGVLLHKVHYSARALPAVWSEENLLEFQLVDRTLRPLFQ